MFTDATPRSKNRQGFSESDRINTLDLPRDAFLLPEIAKSMKQRCRKAKRREFELLALASFQKLPEFIKCPNAVCECWQHDR